jgi:hypothetical protein
MAIAMAKVSLRAYLRLMPSCFGKRLESTFSYFAEIR